MSRYVLRKRPDIIINGIRDNLFWCANLNEFSIFHDRNVVAHLDRLEEIMGDKHHGLADYRL